MPKRSPILPTRELALGDLLAAQASERFSDDVSKRLQPLWSVPLGRLAPTDLLFLVRQGIASSLVLPLALDRLAADPLLAADGERGDLLLGVLSVGLEQLKARQPLRERAWNLLLRAERTFNEHPNWDFPREVIDRARRELG